MRPSNRRCWQITRQTLRVDPRCRQQDALKRYAAELTQQFQSMRTDFMLNSSTFTDDAPKHHGALLAIMTPFLVGSFLTGYRDMYDVLGSQTSPLGLASITTAAQQRAQYSADIMLQTTQEQVGGLTNDDLMDSSPWVFSPARAEGAVVYEGVRGFKSSTERALQASNEDWGKILLIDPASHDRDDICDLNEDAGTIPLGQEFPSGDLCEPAHLFCACSTYYTRM
jgi:hypothetical protein